MDVGGQAVRVAVMGREGERGVGNSVRGKKARKGEPAGAWEIAVAAVGKGVACLVSGYVNRNVVIGKQDK